MDIPAGWYGKLPALGDFASRRLAPAFVERWDGWLAQGLANWRERDPSWLDRYLGGPVWCFVAAAGVLGPHAWVGVLMPSVDRVGRYFPFTVAAPLPVTAAAHGALLRHWLLGAAALAAEALHEDWGAEQVDGALRDLAEATVVPDPGAEHGDELARLLGASVTARGHVLWWRTLDDGAAELQRSQGLPQGDDFARLIAGLPPDTETS